MNFFMANCCLKHFLALTGPRLAANFLPAGSGRGLLGASSGNPSPVPGSPSSFASTPTMPGRGRGRGLLAQLDDDDD